MTPTAIPAAAASRLRRFFLLALKSFAVALVVALVFAASALWTMPVRAVAEFVTVPEQVTGLYGTWRRGKATLVGGYTLEWSLAPGELMRGQAVWHVRLGGEDTELTARLRANIGAVQLEAGKGRAGPGLLALAPGGARLTCDTQVAVRDIRIGLGRRQVFAGGDARLRQGVCTDVASGAIPVPALTLALRQDGSDGVATVLGTDDAPLAEGRMTPAGAAKGTLTRAGAALIPSFPVAGPITLHWQF